MVSFTVRVVEFSYGVQGVPEWTIRSRVFALDQIELDENFRRLLRKLPILFGYTKSSYVTRDIPREYNFDNGQYRERTEPPFHRSAKAFESETKFARLSNDNDRSRSRNCEMRCIFYVSGAQFAFYRFA